MIKKNVPFALLLSFAAITAFVSCSKSKDNNTDQTASLGTATISGKVNARLVDTIGAAGTQYAPEGTVINGWLDSKDLVLGETGSLTYARRYFTTKTDASGNYSLTVDVSMYKPAAIHIEPASFEYYVVKKSSGKVVTQRTIFNSMTAPTVSVNNNDKLLMDITYN
jgi:hypothetical protein